MKYTIYSSSQAGQLVAQTQTTDIDSAEAVFKVCDKKYYLVECYDEQTNEKVTF